MRIFAFPDALPQASAMAAALAVDCLPIEVHRFPDGESRVRLPAVMPGETLAVFRTLDHPNDKLVELMLALVGLREAGAGRLILVAPYLCYMRQDIAFHPGEAVSQRIVGRWLAGMIDGIVTLDPHLHRVARLDEAVPVKAAIALSAAPVMGRFLAQQAEHDLVLGPDRESRQWVEAVARAAGGLEYDVASKAREGDREVSVRLPHRDYGGLRVVIVDDMASTGRTLAAASRALLGQGAAQVDVMVSHPLFAGDAETTVRNAGVSRIWSTDSIPHPTNALPLASLLSAAVLEIAAKTGDG